mgnify:CR=1 FL=1
MSPKKVDKSEGLKKIKNLFSKNLNLNKLKINPSQVIDNTKNKIEKYYLKKRKEKEINKKRLEKQKKIEEKKELQKQKKQEEKERLDKIKEEKRQILLQQKLIIDNEERFRIHEGTKVP